MLPQKHKHEVFCFYPQLKKQKCFGVTFYVYHRVIYEKTALVMMYSIKVMFRQCIKYQIVWLVLPYLSRTF